MIRRSTILALLLTVYVVFPLDLEPFFVLFWMVLIIAGLVAIVLVPVRWALKGVGWISEGQKHVLSFFKITTQIEK